MRRSSLSQVVNCRRYSSTETASLPRRKSSFTDLATGLEIIYTEEEYDTTSPAGQSADRFSMSLDELTRESLVPTRARSREKALQLKALAIAQKRHSFPTSTRRHLFSFGRKNARRTAPSRGRRRVRHHELRRTHTEPTMKIET